MKYSNGFGVLVTIIAIGILVVVTGVGIVIQKRAVGERTRETAKQTTTVSQTTPRVQPSLTQKVITASDITDTKLDKDFSDIDTSMSAINTDATIIDAGLNDKMEDLSE